MRRYVYIMFLLILFTLAGCDDKKEDMIGLKELGIDKSVGEMTNYIDTHGSMGDGSTYIQIEFSKDKGKKLAEYLKTSDYWKPMPLSNNLQIAVYGNADTKSLVTSFEDKIPSIPVISNGYYYFKDRYSDATDQSDDTDLYSRYSFNFDILLYDVDKNILYIYQLDT